MKKFLACVFILAIFTGIVFYAGWTQFRVKPDTIGVVVSKTSGVDSKPVLNGEFAWHWQFLLPTNATLKSFQIKPVNIQKSVSGCLPSGEAYASIYGAQGLFDYSFTFDISLTRAEANSSFRAEALKREEILRGIQIYKDFPELDVTVFAIQSSKLPDYKMYNKISNMQPEQLNGTGLLNSTTASALSSPAMEEL